MTWMSRAIVIYFFLHPLLGKKDLQATSEIFNVNKRTLEGWATKEESKRRWHGMVSDLSFDDIVEALPSCLAPLKIRMMSLTQSDRRKRLILNDNIHTTKLFSKNLNWINRTEPS